MQPIHEEKVLDETHGANEACDGTLTDSRSRRSCLVRGVLLAKSVRYAFCSLHVAAAPESTDDEDDGDDSDEPEIQVVLIRIQFPVSDTLSFRSHCRRFYKNGDLIRWSASRSEGEERRQAKGDYFELDRHVIEPENLADLNSIAIVEKSRYWTMKRCQEFQLKHCLTRDSLTPTCASQKTVLRMKLPVSMKQPLTANETCSDHGIGIEKRVQTEYVTRFFVHMIMSKLYQEDIATNSGQSSSEPPFPDPSEWAMISPVSTDTSFFQRAREFLNNGSGVIDAAGGSGHVSMQLGLLGIQSTVIDSREAVGKLPGRDRKIWNRARRQTQADVRGDTLHCMPVVDYDTRRGWLGPLLQGVDVSFRHPDQETLEVFDSKHEFFDRCTAVIALHPDEATEAIVDMAVAARKPFAIVPCCVFFRLFPKRMIPGTVQPVSTRQDLVKYLKAKHESIQQSTLPFYGASTILWSTFNV